MNKDLIAIFEYLEREKGIKREIVIEAIEESLRQAALKSVKGVGIVEVHLDPKTGDIDVFTQKRIVEKVQNPDEEISLEAAKALAPDSTVGQRIELAVSPQDFGRIAAQTARQIISQKLKGAERDIIYEEYRHRTHEIISGTVKRFLKGKTLVVDLGKVEAILPERFCPETERYRVGDRVQALLWEVRDTEGGGAEVILTRTHPEFVAELFAQEVPEIKDGTVTIEKIVREAGYRTKLAVRSWDSKVDPVGTCVGMQGTRIKNVIRELGEKIDVFPYSDDPVLLLQNAISPVEIQRIKTNRRITVVVQDRDYPTLIGKKGMNARLLAKLIDSELDIQRMSDHQKIISLQMLEQGTQEDPRLDQPLKIEGISSLITGNLIGSGYDTYRKVLLAQPEELMKAVPGMNYLDLADKILEQLRPQES